MGRIHYRSEWTARLVSAETPEDAASFVACVYRTLGSAALEELEGDFAIAVFDHWANRLTAFRDALGLYPLFWTMRRGSFILSTSIRAFASKAIDLEPDPEYAAMYLAYPTSSFSELPTERTAYRGITRLLPGCLVEANLRPGLTEVRRYWKWETKAPSTAPRSHAEAGDVIRSLLRASISERLGVLGTACQFSGGFDSTGVALLAQQIERDHGREVLVVSLIYRHDALLAREDAYIAAGLEGRSGLRPTRILADDLSDFSGHDDFPLLDEPVGMLAGFSTQHAMIDVAARAGADVLLTGDGADQLFAPSSLAIVASELKKGRFQTGVALSYQFARSYNVPRWDILKGAAWLAAPSVLRYAWANRRHGGPPADSMADVASPSWVSRDFARRYAMRSLAIDLRPPRLVTGLFGFGDVGSVAGDWAHWNVAVPRGLKQLRPYFDSRVVAAAISLPLHLYHVPFPSKPILAAALRTVLPEKILYRRHKAHFNSQFVGFAKHKRWLEGVVASASIEFGEIDRHALIDCLRKASMGLFQDAPTAGRLGAALSYLIWRSSRDAWAREKPFLTPLASIIQDADGHASAPVPAPSRE